MEELEIYDLKGKLIGTKERKKYYSDAKKEYEEKGSISKKVKRVVLLLMNSKGRIYLQKRSKIKDENPGLYDKTVGGHVAKDDTYDMTAIRECAEELGFPASVLPDKDFERAVKVTDLKIVGLIRKAGYDPNFKSVRITKNGKKFVQPYMSATYIGYYDGAIRFVDGESSGIEVFSLEELKHDIKAEPGKFTEDVKYMIKRYERFLRPIR